MSPWLMVRSSLEIASILISWNINSLLMCMNHYHKNFWIEEDDHCEETFEIAQDSCRGELRGKREGEGAGSGCLQRLWTPQTNLKIFRGFQLCFVNPAHCKPNMSVYFIEVCIKHQIGIIHNSDRFHSNILLGHVFPFITRLAIVFFTKQTFNPIDTQINYSCPAITRRDSDWYLFNCIILM